MTSEQIETIFEEYITENDLEYALLINGRWGRGKTFFQKNTLTEICVRHQKEFIYISLNGVSAITAIEGMIFLQIVEQSKSVKDLNAKKWVKDLKNHHLFKKLAKTAQAGKRVAEGISKKYLNADLTELTRGITIDLFSFENKILVFDDLERSKLPVEEVLGYINKFVEHRAVKTLILADESQLKRKKKYQRIKEKVIGRVVEFKADISTVYDQFLLRYNEDASFDAFCRKYKDVIIGLFERFEADNLRVLSFYLATLHKLFPQMKESSEPVRWEVVNFTAILCITFKAGDPYKVFDNPIPAVLSMPTIFAVELGPKKAESDWTDHQKFYEKYLKNTFKYRFNEAVYGYVSTGLLNTALLQDELKRAEPVEDTIEQKAMSMIIQRSHGYRDLTDEVFTEQTKVLIESAKNGLYSIYDYVPLSNWLHFFVEKGLIFETSEEVDKLLRDGLEKAKISGKINGERLATLRHFEQTREETKGIQERVSEIHEEIERLRFTEAGNRIFKDFRSDDPTIIKATFANCEDMSFKFMAYLDAEELTKLILSLSNASIEAFRDQFIDRYRAVNIGDVLYAERSNLSYVANRLLDHLKENEVPPLRKLLINDLADNLNSYAEKLERTKPL